MVQERAAADHSQHNSMSRMFVTVVISTFMGVINQAKQSGCGIAWSGKLTTHRFLKATECLSRVA